MTQPKPAEHDPRCEFIAGHFTGISNADYHAGIGLGKSKLVDVLRSPAYFKHAPLRKETDALRIGTLVHEATLEPQTWASRRFMVARKIDRRSGAGKAEHAAMLAEAAEKGLEIIAREELDSIAGMVAAIAAHPIAGPLFCDGVAESSVFYTDPATGLRCKCRPDWLRDDGLVVDLKKAKDASPAGFAKAVGNYHYHVQDAHYCAGLIDTGIEPQAFVFVAVEPLPPYLIGVYVLDDEARSAGQRIRRRCMATLEECFATDMWPGYADTVQTLALPRWAL